MKSFNVIELRTKIKKNWFPDGNTSSLCRNDPLHNKPGKLNFVMEFLVEVERILCKGLISNSILTALSTSINPI